MIAIKSIMITILMTSLVMGDRAGLHGLGICLCVAFHELRGVFSLQCDCRHALAYTGLSLVVLTDFFQTVY